MGLFVGKSYQGARLNDSEIANATLEPVEDLSTQMELYEQLSDLGNPRTHSMQPSEKEVSAQTKEETVEEPPTLPGVMYTIQIGAHSTEAEAKQLLMKLEAKNFTGRIEKPDGDEQPRYFRVWVGEFRTLEEAGSLVTQLKEAGFYTYIRRVK
jgi:cell division septation protein DedD